MKGDEGEMSESAGENTGQENENQAGEENVTEGQGTETGTEDKGDDKGKGGKEQVLADLASERDKRQELEKKLEAATKDGELLGKFKSLLTDGDGKELSPEELKQQLESSQASSKDLARQLAIYKLADGQKGNAAALLDSVSFLRSVEGVDPADHAAIEKAIADAIKADKTGRLSSTPRGGAKDAGAGGGSPTASVDDWIRGAAR